MEMLRNPEAYEAYRQVYEAYQQAIRFNACSSIIWSSLAIIFFQVHQFRDCFDSLSRAARLNPYTQDLWYNVGVLVNKDCFNFPMTTY